jgi:hypothetical protein
MKQLGHTKVDLLKLDIEGAEYKVLNSLVEDALQVEVLCVEYDEYFHGSPGFVDRIRSSLQNLIRAGFVIADTPGNANYTLVRSFK